jgi:hypothetical protein
MLAFTSNKHNRISYFLHKDPKTQGRVIAQAVRRRLSTTAARVRAHVRSCGICGGQSGTWAHFLRVLRFPPPLFIPPTVPHSSSSITRGRHNRPISGRRTKWTQSQPTPKQLTKNNQESTPLIPKTAVQIPSSDRFVLTTYILKV